MPLVYKYVFLKANVFILLAEHASGTGRQGKGNFQGVRVKNSVRELLTRMRNKTLETDDFQVQLFYLVYYFFTSRFLLLTVYSVYKLFPLCKSVNASFVYKEKALIFILHIGY